MCKSYRVQLSSLSARFSYPLLKTFNFLLMYFNHVRCNWILCLHWVLYVVCVHKRKRLLSRYKHYHLWWSSTEEALVAPKYSSIQENPGYWPHSLLYSIILLVLYKEKKICMIKRLQREERRGIMNDFMGSFYSRQKKLAMILPIITHNITYLSLKCLSVLCWLVFCNK